MDERPTTPAPIHHEQSEGHPMSDTHASPGGRREPGHYEIGLACHLDQRWAEWFDGLTLTHQSDGTTVLHGPVVDQAALDGLLQKVRDLGLPLVSVAQVAPDPPDVPTQPR
jgi:hypothetical protein